MSFPRFILAAVAATLVATAAVATPPSADAVTVPQTHMGHHGKLQALFDSPNQFAMFKMQLHQATKGMSKDQRKAYRKSEMQKVKAMTDAEKGSWRQDLQAKWDALPDARKSKIARKMEAHAAKHQSRGAEPQPDSADDMGTPQ